MARDPRIMYVEERDGKPHVLSDKEIEEKEMAEKALFRAFLLLSVIVGPGLMGIIDLFSDYDPSYLGAFVIVNAITTALSIAFKYPDRVGITMIGGTFIFLIMITAVLWVAEWLIGLVFAGFAIPFFWVLAGAWPFYNNWRTAFALHVVRI